jgi:Cation/multidrug efflux pump
VANYAQTSDVDDGFSAGKMQLDFNIRPEGRSLGLTSQDVARQIRAAFYGAEALRQQRGRNEIKVMVRLPENERISLQDIEDFWSAPRPGPAFCCARSPMSRREDPIPASIAATAGGSSPLPPMSRRHPKPAPSRTT